MPATMASAVSWVLLAVGAALFAGTGAALLTYRRTGRMPGDPGNGPVEPVVLRYAAVRCVVGFLAGLLGLVGLGVYGTAI